jgi:hypothetical protein
LSLATWASGKRDDRVAEAKARLKTLKPWKKDPATGLTRVRHPFPVGDRDTYRQGYTTKEIKALIEKAPIKKVPIKDLTAIQHSVIPGRVAQYIDDPRLLERGARKEHGGLVDRPIVIERGGKKWLYDGHHRATAAALLDAPEIDARYVTLNDKEK